jgi:hypothetical protein
LSLTWKTTLYIFLFLGTVFVVVYLFPNSANNSSKPEVNSKTESAVIPPQSIAKEKKLAEVHCQSCHSYPAPGLLPKEVWKEQTLPHMGPQMGIFEHNGTKYTVERTPNLP